MCTPKLTAHVSIVGNKVVEQTNSLMLLLRVAIKQHRSPGSQYTTKTLLNMSEIIIH